MLNNKINMGINTLRYYFANLLFAIYVLVKSIIVLLPFILLEGIKEYIQIVVNFNKGFPTIGGSEPFPSKLDGLNFNSRILEIIFTVGNIPYYSKKERLVAIKSNNK